MRHTTECLHKILPRSYKETLDILIQAAPNVKGFEDMSTRKHYPGQHQISIIVNGIEAVKASFGLEK